MEDGFVLVTGGTGYIGSHTALELLKLNYKVLNIDDLSHSSEESLVRVRKLTQEYFEQQGQSITLEEMEERCVYIKMDIRDYNGLDQVFSKYKIDCVIHFAGFKAVGESNQIPLDYYDVNVGGTIQLLKVMKKHEVYSLVFSSSASVYGKRMDQKPIGEETVGYPMSPYGGSKLMIERILKDLYLSETDKWRFVILRYFNPIGAHESGIIGEDQKNQLNNLLPYVAQVAIGKRKELLVFGGDYETHDGTAIRDYIHVVDLAIGHIRALDKLKEGSGYHVYNLGTGTGYSVLEIVKMFQKVSGKEIPYRIVDRRPGDVPVLVADPTKSRTELSWTAKYDLEKMCKDHWNWQEKNPNGYNTI